MVGLSTAMRMPATAAWPGYTLVTAAAAAQVAWWYGNISCGVSSSEKYMYRFFAKKKGFKGKKKLLVMWLWQDLTIQKNLTFASKLCSHKNI